MKIGKDYFSEDEFHYGILWFIDITRFENHWGAFLHCRDNDASEKWSIATDFEIKFIHPYGKVYSKNKEFSFSKPAGHGWGRFIEWDDLEKDYLMDDQLIVEINVKIHGMTGIYGSPLRSFDNSESSNFTLIIDNKKFHVEKEILATNSLFFNSIFLKSPSQLELKLFGMDPETFQKYLEVVHGEPNAINKTTVEGILFVAAKYSTPTVIQKCEDFLLENWAITAKKKQQMAVDYELKRLKEQCDHIIS